VDLQLWEASLLSLAANAGVIDTRYVRLLAVFFVFLIVTKMPRAATNVRKTRRFRDFGADL
jgi:hypothetical protein